MRNRKDTRARQKRRREQGEAGMERGAPRERKELHAGAKKKTKRRYQADQKRRETGKRRDENTSRQKGNGKIAISFIKHQQASNDCRQTFQIGERAACSDNFSLSFFSLFFSLSDLSLLSL